MEVQSSNSVRKCEKSVLDASVTILSKFSSRLHGSTISDFVTVTILAQKSTRVRVENATQNDSALYQKEKKI